MISIGLYAITNFFLDPLSSPATPTNPFYLIKLMITLPRFFLGVISFYAGPFIFTAGLVLLIMGLIKKRGLAHA